MRARTVPYAKALGSWRSNSPGKNRVLYTIKDGNTSYRGYNPMGSLEPPWLTFLNQMNHMVQVRDCQITRNYLRNRLGNHVRLGPYVWFSYSELDHLDEFRRDVNSVLSTRVSQPYSTREIPWTDYYSRVPPEGGLQSGLFWETLDRPRSVCHSIQHTLYQLQCKVGTIKVPTWYARQFRIPAWILRTRCSSIHDESRKGIAALLRMHYCYYVMLPRILDPKHKSSRGMARSHADLSSHLLWQAWHTRLVCAAAATLHRRLKVLLPSLLMRHPLHGGMDLGP